MLNGGIIRALVPPITLMVLAGVLHWWLCLMMVTIMLCEGVFARVCTYICAKVCLSTETVKICVLCRVGFRSLV